MDKKSFFELEAELSAFFLGEVEKRDRFYHDTPEDEKRMFRFQSMANRAWVYRYIGDQEKASVYAGECYTEVLRTMRIRFPYTAFAFYRYGLTFWDSCDYKTAEWLFQQQHEEAEKTLANSRDQRSPEDRGGLRTTHSNLSKLYFRWAQEIGNKSPEDPRIREYLEKAQKEMEL